MVKRPKTQGISRLIGLFLVTLVFAFAINSYGDSGDAGDAGAFLKNGIGVRPISMGKAFVAIADDAHAGYWNPAGLAILNTAQFGAMYSNPVNYDLIGGAGVKDIGYHTISLAYPAGFGSFGLNVAYLSVGDIFVVEDASGPTGDTFSDKEYGIIASYATSIAEQIHLGTNIKFVHQSLQDEDGSGLGLDLGALYQPLYNLTFGLMLQDLVEPKIQLLEDGEEYSIPRKIRLGMSYKLMDDKVLLAAGVDKASGRSPKLHLGTEVEPMKDLDLRVGYTTDSGEVSAGIGVRVSAIQLDYGFGFLKLGSTHRVSITVDLSRLAE
ncbi:PorV/PorQ family protein [Candidatus Poribacteria bacterium]